MKARQICASKHISSQATVAKKSHAFQKLVVTRRDAVDLASEKQWDDHLGFVDYAASRMRSYGRSESLHEGQDLHALICKYGLDDNTFLTNCIIDMYGNLGLLLDAHNLFNSLPTPNLYSFNIMLKVFSRHGTPHDTQALFNRIQHPDVYSWVTLINAYSHSGRVQDARCVFERMPHRGFVPWTAMIAAYAQNEHGREALSLFYEMHIQGCTPNNLTFTCVLDGCAIIGALDEGQNIHAAVLMQNCDVDVALATSLVNMYGKCGSMSDARNCFTRFPHGNVAPWTAIISALAQHDHGMEAFHFLFEMQCHGIKPDGITFMCALEVSASMEVGELVHAAILDVGLVGDAYINNALVLMYGAFGRLEDATQVFSRSRHKDVVSWTALIAAFVQNGKGRGALISFAQMCAEGILPDKVVLLCIIDACASLQILEKGKEIHACFFNGGFDQDVEVGNALLNMYGKCGSVHLASCVFYELTRRDIVSWNTLLSAFVHNGEEEKAIRVVHEMQAEGCEPDESTFTSIVTACSHGGWVEEGQHILACYVRDKGMQQLPIDHHICMIDLLGRAGHLNEANYLVQMVMLEKISLAWLCLLGACKIHGDRQRGLQVALQYMELDPENTAPYTLLSNLYVDVA